MKYVELREKLKEFVVFSKNDLFKANGDFHAQRLSEWQKKGYIKKITNEYYIFADLELNESALFIIANTIYHPSYISLEMALSYHGLIPESVYTVTSISSRVTKNLNSPIAQFSYKKIKPELLFGYGLVAYGKHNFKMAEIEKAILDYFYFNSHLKTENDFYELRINEDVFKEKVDLEKMGNYLSLFNNKALEKRINNFVTFISNA